MTYDEMLAMLMPALANAEQRRYIRTAAARERPNKIIRKTF